jgi:peptide/nickel transport system permease protein
MKTRTLNIDLFKKTSLWMVFGLILILIAPSLFNISSKTLNYTDVTSIYQSPNFNSPFGTNHFGQNLLPQLILGCRNSLLIGLCATLLSVFIGVLLGTVSGFFGNDSLSIPKNKGLHVIVLLVLLAGVLIVSSRRLSFVHITAWVPNVIVAIALVFGLSKFLSHSILKLSVSERLIYLPLENLIVNFQAIFSALPKLVIIIALSSFMEATILNVVLIIGLTNWLQHSVLINGEVKKYKGTENAIWLWSSGMSKSRILFRHYLPNNIYPLKISIPLGVSSAIIIESSLSFLGLGLPSNVVSLGGLIRLGLANFDYWWLIVFPCIGLFVILLLVFNIVGNNTKGS